MKKLLLIPILAALLMFVLYHKSVDGNVDGIETNPKVTKPKVTNYSHDEIDETIEIIEDREEIEEVEEKFSVKIKGDVNTTKETLVTLFAEVNSTASIEAFNYFWYENGVQVDLGATFQKTFDRGEYNITVSVRDANGEEVSSSVIVRAYNYESITRLHYDAYYGNLRYTERMISNHKGNYVLYDDGGFMREFSYYDDKDNLIEKLTEYYEYPTESRKRLFTYDEKGNVLTEQTFNSDGESTGYILNIYDDNATLIDIKYGTNPDDLDKGQAHYSEVVYEYEHVDNSIVEKEDIQRLNDNGQVVYEEQYYGDTKMVNEMIYNDENKLVKEIRHSESSYDAMLSIVEYDKDGNAVNVERKSELKGYGSCHYRSENTYTTKGQLESRVSVLLGGECNYIDEVKKVYSYDDEGNVVNVKATSDDGDEEGGHITLELIKEYINEIEI